MQLEALPFETQPPGSTLEFYLKMFRERFGANSTAKAIGKVFVGRRV